MGQPVVHFEIIGSDPAKLRSYYGQLFGWEFQIGDATTEAVSQPGSYGFVDGATTGGGINGGVGTISHNTANVIANDAGGPVSGGPLGPRMRGRTGSRHDD